MKPITPLLLAITSASAAMAQTPPLPPAPPAVPPATAAVPPTAQDSPAIPAPPVEPPAAPVKKIDPSTLSLLDQSASAYKSLRGYQATFSQSLRQGGKTVIQAGTLKWAAPQKVRMEWKSDETNLMIVSDGSYLYRYIVGRPQFLKSPVVSGLPGVQAIAAANLEPFLSLLLGGINPLRDKTISSVPLTSIPMEPTKFGDDTLEGVKMIIPQGGGEFTITLWLDPTTRLLRRVDGGVQTEREDVAITMLYTYVQADPQFAPDTFTFTPPKGVTEFVPPKPSAITESVSHDYDPRIKVGTVPFALSGPDLSGKVRSISAYKGKVLLLDFWATWCGPCIGELPNVLKNYTKYHGQGLEILGVSLDSNKAVLTKFVKTKKMTWPQLFDGKEWGSTYAAKYKVQAIPFTLLIGKDGKIAAINPRGAALEPAIQKALKKK